MFVHMQRGLGFVEGAGDMWAICIVHMYVLGARISHISPGIYIKTLYEIIHSTVGEFAPTPHPIRFDSMFRFLCYWSNILNSFGINRS